QIESVVQHAPTLRGNYSRECFRTRVLTSLTHEEHKLWHTPAAKSPLTKLAAHREMYANHHRHTQQARQILPDWIHVLFIAMNKLDLMSTSDRTQMPKRPTKYPRSFLVGKRQRILVSGYPLVSCPNVEITALARNQHWAQSLRRQQSKPSLRRN